MPVIQKKSKVKVKAAVSNFPLRLATSVRKRVESFAAQEGVSQNQFINLVLVEKLAHLEHEEWLKRKPKATPALIAKAKEILRRPTDNEPEEWDKLPEGYVPIRRERLVAISKAEAAGKAE